MDTQDMMIVCMKDKGRIYECDTLRQQILTLEASLRMAGSNGLVLLKENELLRKRVEELESSLLRKKKTKKPPVGSIRYNMGSMTGTIIVAP